MQGNEQSRDIGALGTRADTITWTVEGTQALETAYQAALEAGEPSFEHEGITYTVELARYLIMALTTEFFRRGLWPNLGS